MPRRIESCSRKRCSLDGTWRVFLGDGQMKDICIYVADHRDGQPFVREPYRLLRVGCDGDAIRDDRVSYDSTGESIAFKNFAYCELTGLYWIWKNAEHDIIGMIHYRRSLASPESGEALNCQEIEKALEAHDCLVPEPVTLACSVAEHYCSGHIAYDLLALMGVMEAQPERYRTAFAQVMSSKQIIPCNIMIARKQIFDAYCSWLFSVLLECEQRIDLYTGRDAYQRRVFGFLAERLMMVWLIANDIDCGFYGLKMTDSASSFQELASSDYVLNLMSGIHGLTEDQLFDGDFYLSLYKDVAAHCPPGTPLGHYLADGVYEGRIPSPAYSLIDYANLRPMLRSEVGEMGPPMYDALSCEVKKRDVVISKNLIKGVTECDGIDYAPVYDWAYYTGRYDDVPGDYFHTEEALKHFIGVGIPEGRQGSKGFSLDAFKRKHPWLSKLFGGHNRHYYLWYAYGRGRWRKAIDWRYSE